MGFLVSEGYTKLVELLFKTKHVRLSVAAIERAFTAEQTLLEMVEVVAKHLTEMVIAQLILTVLWDVEKEEEHGKVIAILVKYLSRHFAGMVFLRAVIEKRLVLVELLRDRASLEMRAIALQIALPWGITYVRAVYDGLTERLCGEMLLEATVLNLPFPMAFLQDDCSEGGRFRAQLVKEQLAIPMSDEGPLEKRMKEIYAPFQPEDEA